MPSTICPIERNRLLRWADDCDGGSRYRFVSFDSVRGRLAFYPLDSHDAETNSGFPLTIFSVDQVTQALACGRLVELPETERTAHMQKKGEDLAPADIERWAIRRAIIAALQDAGLAESERLGIAPTNAIFFEPEIFGATVRFVGDRFNWRPVRVRNLFMQWLLHGADDLATIPCTGQWIAKDSSPGESRSKRKSGRRSAYEILHRCTLARFSDFWRARVMAAVIVTRIESGNWSTALVKLRRCKAFYVDIRNRFCHVPGHLGDLRPPGIDAMRIPSSRSLNWHKRAILESLRDEIAPTPARLPTGGNSTDLCNGRHVIWDMDATLLDFIDIAVEADGYQIVVGPPTLILVVERGSNCIVGWFLTVRPESSLCYCYALYNALADKGPRLRQLGFEETPAGIVSGDCDEVFIDRGPGRGHYFVTMAADELDINLTWGRTKIPEDKGDVEGAGGMVQEGVRDQQVDLENSWLIQQTRAELKARTAMLPTGVITTARLAANRTERRHGKAPDRIEASLRGCERMVVEAISKIALAWKSDRFGLTLSMQLQRVPNTRLGIHTAMQEARRGNARAPRCENELLRASLPKYYDCKLRRGVIRKNCVVYGGSREDDCGSEAAAALADYADQWRRLHPNERGSPIVAPIAIPPYGNCALWLREADVIVIPTRDKIKGCYGEEADLEIIEFLNLDFNSEERAYEIQGEPSPRAKASRKTQEESGKVLAAASGKSLEAVASVKMAARRHAQGVEDASHYNDVADKVGLPKVESPTSASKRKAEDSEMPLKDAVILPRVVIDDAVDERKSE